MALTNISLVVLHSLVNIYLFLEIFLFMMFALHKQFQMVNTLVLLEGVQSYI